MYTSLFYLAQLGYGNDKARQILTNSQNLNQNTQESWQRLWDFSVSSVEPIWQALCNFGGFIAAMSLIYLLVKESADRSLDLSRIVEMIRFPLGIGLLLAGNGYYLAGLVLAIKSIALFWINQILNMTFAGVTISDAIGKIQNTLVANTRAREIFAECVDKTGVALAECVQDPVKIQQAQDMLTQLSGNTPLNGTALEQLGQGIASSLVSAINIPFISAMQFFLNLLQWGFVNCVQASLLLSALFAPICLGFSILPASASNIISWFSGFTTLLLMQLGYVIVVGFVAQVLALTEIAGNPLGSSYLDSAFLLFIAVFAPLLVISQAKNVGTGIFDGISRGLKLTGEAAAVAISGGSSLAAKEIAARMAAKSISGADT